MLVARTKPDQEHAAIDPWTVVHFSSGLGSGLIGMGFWPSIAAAVAYEVAEYHLQRAEIGQKFFQVSHPENLVNSVVDVIVYGAGWYCGKKWNETAPSP